MDRRGKWEGMIKIILLIAFAVIALYGIKFLYDSLTKR